MSALACQHVHDRAEPGLDFCRNVEKGFGMPNGQSRVAVAWYTEQDYPSMRSRMADAEVLHDTYAEWIEEANRAVGIIEGEGHVVTKVYVSDRFFKWCADLGLKPEAKARSKFAADESARQDRIWEKPLA